MPIWRLTSDGPVRVAETTPKQEKLLEESLEDWVVREPALLGEPLLIIGRQVLIPDTKDRLDLLALDPQGNGVVVELKRGKLTDPVDVQALRYASYISKWRFDDFENQARAYFGRVGDPDFNFNEVYEQFCAEQGVDEVPDLNSDQRLIVVGSQVKDKLGSVALWLRDHNVDIKVIEVEVYRDGDTMFLRPQVIIPLPVGRFTGTGRPSVGAVSRPWLADGKTWHLDRRCGPKTKEMLLRLDDLLLDNFEITSPRWNQKFYVAYWVGNRLWVWVNTSATTLLLAFFAKSGSFSQAGVAQKLGVQQYDKQASLSEKIGLPSSVVVERHSDNLDRVQLRLKEDFDLEKQEFLELLRDAYKSSPK